MNLWNEYTFWIIIVGAALLGLTAGIIGTFAVLRKESLIGDGNDPKGIFVPQIHKTTSCKL